MAKPYIVERNGKVYVRIPYKDAEGKWKQKWQKADSRSHAQRLIGDLLDQRETLGGESLVNKDTFNEYLDGWLNQAARDWHTQAALSSGCFSSFFTAAVTSAV